METLENHRFLEVKQLESKVSIFRHRTDSSHNHPPCSSSSNTNPNHPRHRQRQIPTQHTPTSSNNPTPTPIPSTATPTVQFQLFFPNGTAYPTSVTGAITGVNTVVVDPMTGHNGGWMPTCIVVRNTGNTPITINAAIANKNVPSNIDLTLTSGYYGTISGGYGADQATTQQPIQPGQTYYMSLIAFLTPTGSYTPDQQFSYSFDVVVTATQA